jgi:hypothetical protein
MEQTTPEGNDLISAARSLGENQDRTTLLEQSFQRTKRIAVHTWLSVDQNSAQAPFGNEFPEPARAQ